MGLLVVGFTRRLASHPATPLLGRRFFSGGVPALLIFGVYQGVTARIRVILGATSRDLTKTLRCSLGSKTPD